MDSDRRSWKAGVMAAGQVAACGILSGPDAKAIQGRLESRIAERQGGAFSGAGSSDDDTMISWEYNFGDGTTRNWGDFISHT